MICHAKYLSPLGGMTMTSDGQRLTGLFFDGQRHMPKDAGRLDAGLEVFKATSAWLDGYFAGAREPADLPLSLDGLSEFNRRVCEKLKEIPYGKTVCYGDIAKALRNELGRPAFARAVGGAVGRNPIAIIIPCHRVIGASGALTGYAAGLDKKIALLTLEGVKLK